MKNLAIRDVEKLEDLPSVDRARVPRGEWRQWGSDYPHNKVRRFLQSRVGCHWNDVFSEFCHLEWLPQQYKTKEQVSRAVMLNTFMKDGKVWCYDGFTYGGRAIDDTNQHFYYFGREEFYVHPETCILYSRKEVTHNANYYKKKKEKEQRKYMIILGDYHQLLKINGVWFEVKGEPKKNNVVIYGGLHYRVSEIKLWYEIRDGRLFYKHTEYGEWVEYDSKENYRIVDGKLYTPCSARWEHLGPFNPRTCMISGVDINEPKQYWKRSRYEGIKITMYKQLDHKQLKKHGLRNDPKFLRNGCKVCGGFNCNLPHGKTIF